MKNGLFVLLLVLSGAMAGVLPVQADEVPAIPVRIGKLPAARVLYLGNSITLHGPAPAIGWTGTWGMAASAKEKDYVSLLTADLAKAAGTRPEIQVRNIADFERGHVTFDLAKEFKAELAFAPDIVILAIGENVADHRPGQSRVCRRLLEADRYLSASGETDHLCPKLFLAKPDQGRDHAQCRHSGGSGFRRHCQTRFR